MIKLNMELPPEVARRFVEDMDAFRDGIALRQLHALRGATPDLACPT